MFAKKAALMLFMAASLSLSFAALAQTPAKGPEDRLVERYGALAGSETNAKALVTGLRDGSEIKLASGGKTTTFDPPTRKMGYGNVDNALVLAEASLKKQGITNPTPDQLKSALTEVLRMRADGKGWGEIANSMGFRLGELKSALHRPEKIERVSHQAKPERPEKPEKPQRPEKPERPERPSR
jgi:hypothetical protein